MSQKKEVVWLLSLSSHGASVAGGLILYGRLNEDIHVLIFTLFTIVT